MPNLEEEEEVKIKMLQHEIQKAAYISNLTIEELKSCIQDLGKSTTNKTEILARQICSYVVNFGELPKSYQDLKMRPLIEINGRKSSDIINGSDLRNTLDISIVDS